VSDGYLARWRGTEYDASPYAAGDAVGVRLFRPDPAPGFDEVRPGRHRRVVPAGEVERLVHVRDVGEWRGLPVQVLHEQGPDLVVLYTGGLDPVARLAGFDRVERGVWLAVAPPAEIRGRRDEMVVLW